ncbi:Pentatricopeptide repeat-containing protein, mitochondrial [Vitis vinifera]|uniref:Pentatricopeptide repeat-containing protein, mitochondrial n=1 Tax=Vitis vinifera TaxID=29760 RepID=A0A438I1F5_VITVI|nr:Pentatricopeptide repeat-containing protein, mitochondrial [Vitis vinifera]
MGLRIKKLIDNKNLGSNMIVSTAMLEMYVKCGAVDDGRLVFDHMARRDVVAWSAMIAVGSVETGERIGSYVESRGLISNVYVASALLAINGFAEDAIALYNRMKEIEDGSGAQCCNMGTLLSASRIHLNVELAELAGKKLLELEPDNSGNYVILSNIYASASRWQEALKVRKLMKDKRVQKAAAYSWVEVEDRVHKFLVGDTSHPRSDEVYSTIDGLALLSTWVGYELDFEIEA